VSKPRAPLFWNYEKKEKIKMKNILCSLVALVCVAGVAKADDSILGTTATVKMEKSASAWFNNGYYGAVRDTKTNEDSPVALWDVPQVKARLLSVKVNPVVGVQFGNTARKSAVVAGLVVPVATVKGTQVSFVGTVGVGENWTKRPNGSLGLVVRR
jgi:hypothetical protein